jgi:enoyl-CoA hydratase/carnithine racemase
MLRIQDRERVRLVTLCRPEVLNAFNSALWSAFGDALIGASSSPYVAAVVITGEGRAFTTGQDLGEMAQLGRMMTESHPGGHAFAKAMDALEAFDKPLLAAVNGVAVGFGLTLLAHCDLVLVADGARLRAPFVSLGVAPEAASSYLLPQLMGWQGAAHTLYTGAWIDAHEAVARGLAWKRCHPDELLAETMVIAREIAAHPVEGLVATKRLLKAARAPEIAAARAREDEAFRQLVGAAANRAALDEFFSREAEPQT